MLIGHIRDMEIDTWVNSLVPPGGAFMCTSAHVCLRTDTPSLCELSKVVCLPSSSLLQPGLLSLCAKLGLGGCQPVAGEWAEGRPPWVRALLPSQLLPGRWLRPEQLRSPSAGILGQVVLLLAA